MSDRSCNHTHCFEDVTCALGWPDKRSCTYHVDVIHPYDLCVSDGPLDRPVIYAIAAFTMLHPTIHIVKTTRPELIGARAVIGVGGIYNPDADWFDIPSQPMLRSNGEPYTVFGLVWKKAGEPLVISSTSAHEAREDRWYAEIAESIDRRFVRRVGCGEGKVVCSRLLHAVEEAQNTLRKELRDAVSGGEG